jgi:prephenate dehydrogenase
MKQNKNADTKILIVGLGLLGGSYARALKKKGYTVYAIDQNEDSIDYALERNIIDYGSTVVEENFIKEAVITVFALYPHVFLDWIRENGEKFPDGAYLTDVTGVKGQIVDTVQALLREDVEFIAAHPMAGRERSGVHFSDDEIFKGANYIVTPTERNTEEGIEACRELGRILGFRTVSELSCEEHDRMIAFLSQLTHCIAITLMTCNDKEHMEKFTGDSFRDLTRIARINDLMWSELFVANKAALLEQMDLFIDKFLYLFRCLKFFVSKLRLSKNTVAQRHDLITMFVNGLAYELF